MNLNGRRELVETVVDLLVLFRNNSFVFTSQFFYAVIYADIQQINNKFEFNFDELILLFI